jgi:hypothetical protein
MPRSLAEIVRDKLDVGRLPLLDPVTLWVGAGSGMPCSVCGKTIQPYQVEYEPDYDARLVRVRFHIGCHGLWEEERRRRAGTSLD